MPADAPSDLESHDDLPPSRHNFWRTASKIALAHLLLILAILIPLGVHENRQAERDWNTFKAHWEAKGEIFDLKKLIPPEISDEENFAAAPIIAEIFTNPNDNRLANLDFRKLPGFAEYPESYENPINAKQQALGGYKIKLANYFNEPKKFSTDQAAAIAILKALKPWDAILTEFDQASHRPKARYPIEYERIKWDTPYNFLTAQQTPVKTLHLRAQARLTLENSEGAAQDILTNLRIANLIGSDPTLISHATENRIVSQSLQGIWTGLQSKQFATELLGINRSLSRIKIKTRLTRAIRFNRSCDLLITQQDLEYFCREYNTLPDLLMVSLIFKHLGLSQAFWLNNHRNSSQIIQEHFLTFKGKVNHSWLDLDAAEHANAAIRKPKAAPLLNFPPYYALISFSGTSYYAFAQHTAQVATRIDLARIAIALELYHRKHGQYPGTLAPLAPSYLDTIPRDLITGDPLHYRIKADGTPIIYSVGLNKTDDGGQVKKRHTQGDWVWQYTLPDNFTEADWRK